LQLQLLFFFSYRRLKVFLNVGRRSGEKCVFFFFSLIRGLEKSYALCLKEEEQAPRGKNTRFSSSLKMLDEYGFKLWNRVQN